MTCHCQYHDKDADKNVNAWLCCAATVFFFKLSFYLICIFYGIYCIAHVPPVRVILNNETALNIAKRFSKQYLDTKKNP